jgi:signal transduction histidine kinase
MNQVKSIIAFFMILGIAATSANAEESRKKMLMDAVDHGVKTLETKGKAGMDELKTYRFADGEGYIYILSMDWVMIMHPVAPELVNKDTTTTKDAKGKYFGAEMKGKAIKYGSGWTSYWWPNPKTNNTPELKCSYYRVTSMDGRKVIVAAGLFGVSETECK